MKPDRLKRLIVGAGYPKDTKVTQQLLMCDGFGRRRVVQRTPMQSRDQNESGIHLAERKRQDTHVWLCWFWRLPVPLDTPTPLYQGERLKDLILCYAGPWAFVPYLRKREDEELLWHARQGVLLAFVEAVVALALIISGFFPLVGDLALRFVLPLWLLWCLIMSVASILQATKGKRHRIPVLHQFVDYL
jgi:uncharacterized membrane protein